MRKLPTAPFLQGVAGTMLVGLSLASCAHKDEPTPAPALSIAAPQERTEYRLPDCEDQDGPSVPCVTYDESEWRLITHYEPYTFTPLTECAAGATLPCVGPEQDGSGNWPVFTDGEVYD